jgi:Glutaredoxin-like domain (DUF836)
MNALLRRFRRPDSTLIVTLYTRAGCHLCDDAKKPVVRAVAATPGASLRTVDIAGNADLESRYGVRIPVVTVTVAGAEQVVAELKISDLRLRRAFGALTAEG